MESCHSVFPGCFRFRPESEIIPDNLIRVMPAQGRSQIPSLLTTFKEGGISLSFLSAELHGSQLPNRKLSSSSDALTF